MLHNYFFIRKLSTSLHEKIGGWQIATCFTQNKNELVIGLVQGHEQWYMRVNLDPNANLITFSEDFHRARKNSVDLYAEVIGQQIQAVVQVPFDRSFYFQLANGDLLIFKLHGRRSNVIHRSQEGPVTLFRNKLAADREATPESLSKAIEISSPQTQDIELLRRLMGKFYLSETASDDDVLTLSQQLVSAEVFYIAQQDGKPPGISLIPVDHPIAETRDPLEACNLLFRSYMHDYLFVFEKETLKKMLDKRLQRAQHYIQRNEKELASLETKRSYQEIADIVMANLHQIPEVGGEVQLHDFYRDQSLTLTIKQGVKPQKYAENLYRKAKNQKIQLEKLQENIDLKLDQMATLEEWQTELAAIQDFKALRQFQKKYQLEERSPQEDEAVLPYKERTFMGYTILIGKNAKANDELTLRHARKDDLWLHARDVAGSHVVIRKPDKSNIPNNVIEKAAALAAYYSKRKTDTLCPVIVTPRKFVRKRKGSPPGQVVVDREEVVMVRPESD